MDSLSQFFFASRDIAMARKGNEKKAQSLEREWFGCAMQPRDWADLLGIPRGASIIVECQETEFGPVLAIEVQHEQFELRAYAAVTEVENRADFWWHQFSVRDTAPRGVATRIIARQAHYAPRYRVATINLIAFGDPDSDYVGYYVWPRLGFNRDLSDYGAKLAAAGYGDVPDTNTLFQREGGPEWWAANGEEGYAEMDLRVGSPSLKILNDYLRKEGVDVDDETKR